MDDKLSYGPETTTIYIPCEGEYTFFVPNAVGTVWKVFSYNSVNRRITAINEMYYGIPNMQSMDTYFLEEIENVAVFKEEEEQVIEEIVEEIEQDVE